MRIKRCTNLYPIDPKVETVPEMRVQCSCWIAKWPFLSQTTSSMRADQFGQASWEEDLWVPLPAGTDVTICIDLRLQLEWKGCLTTNLASANGEHRGRGSITLSGEGRSWAWVQIDGNGTIRSDGLPLGTAELQLTYWIHKVVPLQPIRVGL